MALKSIFDWDAGNASALFCFLPFIWANKFAPTRHENPAPPSLYGLPCCRGEFIRPSRLAELSDVA